MAPKDATKVKSTPAAAKDGKVKKAGAKKDKDAPKRPLSAYMFMSQDWRERIKESNPDASFGEVGRLLGAKWSSMSEGEKKPYNDMAERDKVRAATEKAAYEKTHPPAKKGKKSEE